jgi:hypothetical protein
MKNKDSYFDRSLFDEFLPEADSESENNYPCKCKADWLMVNGTPTCTNCGICDIDKRAFQINKYSGTFNLSWSSRKVPYNRKRYFKTRLNLLMGYIQSPKTPAYKHMISQLKICLAFNSIRQLRTSMKVQGFNKFYPFIYNIWYEVKGTRVVNISVAQYHILRKQFDDFNRWFRHTKKERNIVNYSVFLYAVLKHNNIEGYENLFLPQKNKHSFKIVKQYYQYLNKKSQ